MALLLYLQYKLTDGQKPSVDIDRTSYHLL